MTTRSRLTRRQQRTPATAPRRVVLRVSRLVVGIAAAAAASATGGGATPAHAAFLAGTTTRRCRDAPRPLVPSLSPRPRPHRRRMTHNAGPSRCHLMRDDSRGTTTAAAADDDDEEVGGGIWNPSLRRVGGAIATLGAVETGYLSYVKLVLGSEGLRTSALCSSASQGGSCGSVLDSPYASIGGVPLTVIGFCAYSMVLFLSISPLLSSKESPGKAEDVGNDVRDDSLNRLALLSITTAMATFSAFLMSTLIFVLHASCTYCVISAALSTSLAALTWFGGAAGTGGGRLARNAAASALASVVVTTAAATGIFLNADRDGQNVASPSSSSSLVASTSSQAASTSKPPMELSSPPPITTTSSARALQLSAELQALDARFFGAFWCSHCYEQKEAMGREAMRNIPYVECSRDGVDSKYTMCKERKVPGYPTWEIGGKLFPGEMSLDQLEDIVRDVKMGKP